VTKFRKPPPHLADLFCGGELEVFIENESSFRCVDCGWIGWPQVELAEDNSGVVLAFSPHPRPRVRGTLAAPL